MSTSMNRFFSLASTRNFAFHLQHRHPKCSILSSFPLTVGRTISNSATTQPRLSALSGTEIFPAAQLDDTNHRILRNQQEVKKPANLKILQNRVEPNQDRHHRLAEVGRLIDEQGHITLDPIYLRDACDCARCIDSSTHQRNFNFFDIPVNICPKSVIESDGGLWKVTWENDVPGFADHISEYPTNRLRELANSAQRDVETKIKQLHRKSWHKTSFEKEKKLVNYEEYMNNPSGLAEVLYQLHHSGLAFLTGVPSIPESVTKIVERIGPVRNTFYGLSWDVRTELNPINVAYTSQNLDFHMDLLYMTEPPTFQFLHCMTNTCEGGESRFADTSKVVEIMKVEYPEFYESLRSHPIAYEYVNNGNYYKFLRSIIEADPFEESLGRVFWSPPFMGHVPTNLSPSEMKTFILAAKTFAELLEREDLVYETKMEEGTCAIFHNLRVVHARKAFDAPNGKRWLRGAYLDSQDFQSKLTDLWRTISELKENGSSTALA